MRLSRQYEVGVEVGEGLQHEAPFGEAGVGHGEALGIDALIVVGEDVEVDGARSPATAGAAADGVLDGLEGVEEGDRFEVGFGEEDGVEEGGLVGDADGGGLVEGGEASQVDR